MGRRENRTTIIKHEPRITILNIMKREKNGKITIIVYLFRVHVNVANKINRRMMNKRLNRSISVFIQPYLPSSYNRLTSLNRAKTYQNITNYCYVIEISINNISKNLSQRPLLLGTEIKFKNLQLDLTFLLDFSLCNN